MSESSTQTAGTPQARETPDRSPSQDDDEGPKTWPIGTVIVVPIGLLLFIGIVQLMFLIASPAKVDSTQLSPEQKLRERQSEDQKRLTTYGWVDFKAKTAYIPIERAMELQAADAANSKALGLSKEPK